MDVDRLLELVVAALVVEMGYPDWRARLMVAKNEVGIRREYKNLPRRLAMEIERREPQGRTL